MDDINLPAPQSNSSNAVEQLSSGITREWLHDGQIVIYTLADVRRETVDAWAEAFKSDIMRCPADQVFRVMHDLRIAGGVTPYGREVGKQMFVACPDVTARVALVLPATIINELIRLYVRTQSRPSASRTREFFRTREDALLWLSQED